MNIFDQYGIKEAADVTISSIHKKKDGSGGLYRLPALFLDTLKVATTEKYKFISIDDVTKEIRDGKKGIGGIGSNGRMTVM